MAPERITANPISAKCLERENCASAEKSFSSINVLRTERAGRRLGYDCRSRGQPIRCVIQSWIDQLDVVQPWRKMSTMNRRICHPAFINRRSKPTDCLLWHPSGSMRGHRRYSCLHNMQRVTSSICGGCDRVKFAWYCRHFGHKRLCSASSLMSEPEWILIDR